MLASIVSHVCFYWAAHQRELADAQAQLKIARERIAEKEASLTRAAAIAAGLKQASGHAAAGGGPALHAGKTPWRARGPPPGSGRDGGRGGGGSTAKDIVEF